MTDPSTGRLPTFLIIGAAKSGTTSLSEWLRSHPQVFVPRSKEVRYFDRYFEEGGTHEAYRRHFMDAGDALAIGEGTPYMPHPEAAKRISSVLPDAKLIAILRNPVERAYSHYWHMRAFDAETRSFGVAVTDELSGANTEPGYVENGRYLDHLDRFMQHYNRDRLLVLISEELNSRPQDAFRQVCRFLDVEEIVPANVGRVYNPSFRIRSQRLWNFQLKYQQKLRLPWKMRYLLRDLNTEKIGYPPMDDSVRESLEKEFSDANAKLGLFLARDLTSWPENLTPED